MNKVLFLAVLSTNLFTHAEAGVKVVYGVDNRQEVYDALPAHQLLARSTAVMVPNSEIKRSSQMSGTVKLSQYNLRDWLKSIGKKDQDEDDKEVEEYRYTKMHDLKLAVKTGYGFCAETPFIDQPNPGSCSGFLIAPDLLVTAGHCVEDEDFCDGNEWVFDFNLDKETQTAGLDIKEENTYRCEKVITSALDDHLSLDYAIVQLDRVVTNRVPLELQGESKIQDHQEVLVIGSPSGLPTKVSAGARVRRNINPNFFSANLDAFQGNSGSAVFNATTGAVEGILVRGEDDFAPNLRNKCVEVYTCADNACRGEDVSRLTTIPEVANQKAFYQAAETGDIELLKTIINKKIWIDFYTRDGQSALIKASRAGQLESVKLLLSKKSDVNLQDAEGDTALHKLAAILSVENVDVLFTLIRAGADLELENLKGETPLSVAMRLGNEKGVLALSDAGAVTR